MATLKVGQFYPATVTSSDPADPVNPSTIAASSDNQAVVQVVPGDQAGMFKVQAVSPGVGNLTYSAPGFLPVMEQVTVKPVSQLVVTDGPVQP
jgi:hypothetical protein